MLSPIGGNINVVVSELGSTPVAALPVEIVERKWLGHPNTLCDALAEEVGPAAMGIGFAPLTHLEGAVLAAEMGLREDKVKGVRIGARSTLTVACAFET